MKKLFKILGALFIVGGVVLLISGWFYLSQYRPTEIRRVCAEEATKIHTSKRIRENNNYRECLVRRGLKPESLFVDTQ